VITGGWRRHPAGGTLSGPAAEPLGCDMTPTLRPLHGYEPTGNHAITDPDPDERWSSPRPRTEPQVTMAGAKPDDGQFRVMLTKVLEVLDGRRHIGQLRTLLADPIYEATLTRLRTTPRDLRYLLYSVHACWPAPDAVELTGRVETARGSARRFQALAARLERRQGTWKCVFLRLIDSEVSLRSACRT
jgi:uncharacterized protein DUF6459